MTDSMPASEGIEPRDDATGAQLAALALVRLCILDEPAKLSVRLLTAQDGTVDLRVVQEVVYLAANVIQALADVSGIPPDAILDDMVRHVVEEANDDE